MRIAAAALVFATLAAWPAAADVISPHPDAVLLTIYHEPNSSVPQHPDREPDSRRDGIALIRETRILDLPAGASVVRFRGVASTMVPQSATIDGLPNGAAEQNFDYDLLTPGALLAKSIGAKVHVVRTNPGSGKSIDRVAVVRSGPNGTMLESNGRYEALDCAGLPEKLVFDAIPKGLSDTPTLSLHARVPHAGRYAISLSYLATGLNWAATYVARVSADYTTVDLSGWLTIANSGSTTFGNIPVEVVAGHFSETGNDVPIDPPHVQTSAQCWPTSIDWATPGFVRRPSLLVPPPPPPAPARRAYDLQTVPVAITAIYSRPLGDYKLYPLSEPTTVAALQTKQVQFLDRRGMPVEKVYFVSFNRGRISSSEHAQVAYRVANGERDGAGKPLPAGDVSLRDANAVLLGQDQWGDTPVGVPLQIPAGTSSNVLIDDSIVASHAVKPSDTREEHLVTVFNAKPVTINFELQPDFYNYPGSIVSESRAHVDGPFGTAWHFVLAAGETQTIRYVIDWQH